MLMTKLYAASLLGCLFFILACDELYFSPTKQNFVSLPKPPLGIFIDLTAPTDTIYAWGNVRLKYKTDLERFGYRFSFIVIHVDTFKLGTTENQNEFEFDSKRLPNGRHKLRLELWAQTQSQSLAGRLGQEFAFNIREWPIVIDNMPPSWPYNNNLKPVQRLNGRLRLSWLPYTRINFQEYRIVQSSYDSEGRIDTKLRAIIKDRRVTSWVDSLYVGGQITYWMELQAGGMILGCASQSYSHNITNYLEVLPSTGAHVTLRWRKNPYNNFRYYAVRRKSFSGDPQPEIIYTTNDAADTVYVDDKIGFGNWAYYQILAGPGFPIPAASKEVHTFIGNHCPPHASVKHISSLNSIYLIGMNRTYRLDGNTLEKLAEANFHVGLTADGSFASGFSEYYSSDLPFTNPVTLRHTEAIPTSNLVGYNSFFNGLQVAQPRKVFYAGYKRSADYHQHPDSIMVLDVNARRKVAALPFVLGSTTTVAQVTYDGKYVLLSEPISGRGKLFQREGRFWQEKGQLLPADFFIFTADGQYYLTTDNNQISKRQCGDQSLVSQFAIAASLKRPMIDPDNGYLGGYVADEFHPK